MGNAAVASVLASRRLAGPPAEQGGDVPLQRQGTAVAKKPASATTITTTNDTYTVNATSLDEAAAVFAGRAEAGETTWQPVHNVVTQDGVVVSATVTVPVTVLMPKWPGASKLSSAAQAEWKRASAALKRHEQHHVDLAKQHLKDLHTKLISKTQEEAGAIFTEAVEKLQKASDDYDTATKHGQTEGTDLDTSIK
jgi:predicted secreted Zn-dependent protease